MKAINSCNAVLSFCAIFVLFAVNSTAEFGVNGRDRDGDEFEFIGFRQERFQIRGLHQPGFDQQFRLRFMYLSGVAPFLAGS